MVESNGKSDSLEILASEYIERLRAGANPTVDEYAAAHPALAAEIRDFFPTIAAVEGLKGQKEKTADGRVSLGAPRLERLGDFRIIREIGRGGMGIVYEAVQESLDRTVAIKVLPRQSLLEPSHLKRFEREARIAANLHHTNIVEVFGVGIDDGFHYYVMQYVQGVGLDRVITNLARRKYTENTELEAVVAELLVPHAAPAGESALGRSCAANLGQRYWRSVARAGMQIASALEYAHALGTLHRDIKPGNLLLDRQGVYRITDFGLARAIQTESATLTGEVSGTLRYMAPEQLNGKADARSDLYSLGLSLYELLSLRPAHDATERTALLQQIARNEPVSLRKACPRIPRDLETIILKATALDPRQRYQTAGALADDLQCFLEDRPIKARRTYAAERFVRWCRRNRLVAALSAIAAVSLLLALVMGWIGYVRTQEALRRESQRRQEADAATRRAEANMAMSLQALEEMLGQIQPADKQNSLSLPPPSPGTPDPQPRRHVAEESKETAAQMKSILKFYDRFTAENTANAQLQTVAAKAYLHIGEIQQLLGEFEQACVAYERELAISDALRREAPGNLEYAWLSAQAHHRLGMVLRRTNQLKDTEAHFRQALAMTEDLARQDANNSTRVLEVSQMRFALGEFLFRQGQPQDARKLVEQSLAEARSCQQPELRPRSEGQQAAQYSCLAEILASLGEQRLAEEARRKAKQLGRPPPPRERQEPPPPPD